VDEEQSVVKPSYAWPDPSGMRVGVRYPVPDVQWRMYALNEDQLANLERGGESFSLGLLGLSGGVAFSALTTLLTVELSDRNLAVFVGFGVSSFILSMWFALQVRRDRKSMHELMARIREQHPR
jgi:hypothetical protein